MSEKLKPCPHCGGPSKLDEHLPYGKDGPPYWKGECKGDCANAFLDPAGAVAAWNARAELAEVASLRARLVSAERALTTIATQGDPEASGDRPVDVARAALAAMEVEGDVPGGEDDLRGRLAAAEVALRTLAGMCVYPCELLCGTWVHHIVDGLQHHGSCVGTDDEGRPIGYASEERAIEVIFATLGLAPEADAPATEGTPDAAAGEGA